jgi:hypothetical protein
MWHVRGQKIHTGFYFGSLRKRDHLEDISLMERMILKSVSKFAWEKVDCTNLA